ncbi:3-hydroxyacyl-CoA dehydrogenase family protein [Corynebacterium liangguodongii]|uniref:3-hydroxyacyl-CoA dehydrogenase n=1 Tax=Corynebacterium liangguodongii TaxID=2079535 RepID=A0A2S0WF87_9CORY|nr:3-hydroxyacyl-CoA dehydrogenase family protein [Corynebacterium liangguodongii]AWB84445.1 3-hydroxyacyl-CoA dehydrogenase [Corynebacterium liangguodongii]PWB99934.1 3-hydroxyacyl-CoA dehydrogenase family protein [Corynebacterium liangguodongii]
MKDIEKVTVIGSGTMGRQIGIVAALAGFTTSIVDISEDALSAAKDELHRRMDRDVEKGRRTREDVDAAFARLSLTTNQAEAVADTDIVIEAAVEDIDIKRKVFAQLDEQSPKHAILATNSSNIVSSRLADATSRPEKVCNMHFFNPVLVMKACEVVGSDQTSQETLEAVENLAVAMGKDVIRVRKEIPGFVANRLLAAIRTEALKLYQDGYASFEDIDTAARSALRHPMGPFELMDLVGIDVAYLIRKAEYDQTGEEDSLPSPVLEKMYNSGNYGKKTGQGWYVYDEQGNKVRPSDV